MNTVAFSAKRTFLTFLRVARKPLQCWPGLTGARVDMLSAFLYGERERPRCIELSQFELRRKLGVCASVVSRMVRALVKLGWLRRWRSTEDRRTWQLALTAKGEEVIRAARRLLLRAFERLVFVALCCGWRRSKRWQDNAVIEIWLGLSHIRYQFGDRATLDYHWRGALYDH